MDSKLIGKKAYITDKESIYHNEWGIIKYADNDYYHIAIANSESTCAFERKEFRVRKEN